MSGKASGSEGLPWVRMLWSLKGRGDDSYHQTLILIIFNTTCESKTNTAVRSALSGYLNAWWYVVDDAYGFAVRVSW